MLGFAFAEYTKSANRHGLSPTEFALHVQRRSIEVAASQINEISESSGVCAAVVDGNLCIRVTDGVTAHRALRRAGLSNEEVEELTRTLTANPSEDWSNFRGLVAQIHNYCRPVLDDEIPVFSETPVVACALSFFNAGASPAPGTGNIITINIGLFESALWPLALERTLEGKQLGLTKRQRQEIAAMLPALAVVLMEGADAMYRDPALLTVTSDVAALVGGREIKVTPLTGFSQAFVLLHEYGHIIKGHTDEIRDWPPAGELISQRHTDLLARSRSMEFEADAFASERCERLFGGDATRTGLMLLFLLFHAHWHLTKQKPAELRTHPPPRERYEAAMSFVRSESGINNWLVRFDKMAEFLHHIVDTLNKDSDS